MSENLIDEGLSEKATIALDDLKSNGGILTVDQANQFIRILQEQPTLLRLCRTVPMNTPTMELNKIGFGSRILRAARQKANRAPTEDERSTPETSQVNLETSEVIAEVMIPYEVLEDNIERGALQNTILTLIAQQAALDLEELLIQGDVGSSDQFLASADGVLKMSTAHIVNNGKVGPTADMFNNAMLAMPNKYLRNRAAMRFIVPPTVEQNYRLALSNRGTSLGDDILTGNSPVPVFGVRMRSAALLPQSNALLMDPQNLILGVQRRIRIESERLISERMIKVVLTARVATAIEEDDAVVQITNIA